MKFAINPFAGEGFFQIPAIVEKRLKIASHEQLKVIIWVCKNTAGEFDANTVSEALRLDKSTVSDALDYWAECGALLKKDPPTTPPEKVEPKKAVRAATVMPTRLEVARRGNECKEIAYLLREAQVKLGRALKESEASLIVWLYDDQGISLPLMMMIFEHAVASKSFRAGFIEKLAMEWIDAGISTPQDAEKYIMDKKAKESAWGTVERAMGIPHRKPSDKEQVLADKWVNEWGISFELIKEGYNVCIDAKAKISMPYIDKIIESWYLAGIKTKEDIALFNEKKAEKSIGKKGAAYEISAAKKNMFSDEDK